MPIYRLKTYVLVCEECDREIIIQAEHPTSKRALKQIDDWGWSIFEKRMSPGQLVFVWCYHHKERKNATSDGATEAR
jgi:hypothetical protein